MKARSENVLFGKTEDWDLEEDDVIFRDEEPMPFIAFSNRVHERLAHPWVHFVVVKILGRNLGYHVLLTRLKSIWSRDGKIRVWFWVRPSRFWTRMSFSFIKPGYKPRFFACGSGPGSTRKN